MSYTVSELFNSALTVFSGTTANSFQDKQTLIWDALRAVRRNVDIPEAKRVVPITPVLIDGDFTYTEPADVDIPLGILPTQGRSIGNPINDFIRTSGEVMDNGFLTRNLSTNYTREYRMGVPLLRINSGASPQTRLVLQNFVSLTENGTVSLGGDASNASISNVWFLTDNSSLAFDITQSTGVSTITTTLTGNEIKDISNISADGVFTASIFVPAELVNRISNVSLRVGTDSSNYIHASVNKNSYGGAFTQGFNDIIIPRRAMTTVGTVDNTQIGHLQLRITHTLENAQSALGVRVDNITAHQGQGVSFMYYSKFMFIDANSGAFLDKPVSSGLSEKLILNKDTFDLAVFELQKLMDMRRAGNNQGDVYRNAQRELFGLQGVQKEEGAYIKYKRRFPSERQPQITTYVS